MAGDKVKLQFPGRHSSLGAMEGEPPPQHLRTEHFKPQEVWGVGGARNSFCLSLELSATS